MNEQMTPDVGDALTALFGEASTSTVFSEPQQHGEDLIITAASWERAGGFGFGSGEGGNGDAGLGGGGGGSSQGRPVAVIRISADGVEVEPVVDLTKVAITAFFSLVAVWRMLRATR